MTDEYNFHIPWRHAIRVEQIVAPVRRPFSPCASTITRST